MSANNNNARFQPTLTQAGTFQTLSSYRDWYANSLAQANLPPIEAFWGLVSEFGKIGFGDLATHDRRISQFALTVALHTATCNLSPTHPLFPKGTNKFIAQPEFAAMAAIDAEGVHSDFYVNARSAEDKHSANVLNMIWILCENGIYQGDFAYKVVNQLVLTGLAGFRGLRKDEHQVERLFQSELGVSASDYFLSLYGIWALSQSHGNLNLETIIAAGEKKSRLDKACKSVLDDISLPHSQHIVKAGKEPYNRYSGKSLPIAIFSRWPLVNLNDEIYVYSGQQLMKVQLTTKFLKKALALARAREGKSDSLFSQYIGTNRLEPFFRELCDLWNPNGGHYGEYEYDRRKNSKGPDRVAFEQSGGSTVAHLFQLKLKSLNETSHFGLSTEIVLTDLSNAFAKTISQSIKFLHGLNQTAAGNFLNPEHTDLSKRILAADRYCLLGITPDLPPIFIFKQIRDEVLKIAESKLNDKERKWYEASLKGKFLWHIFELPEFEVLTTLPAGARNFYEILTSYFQESRIDEFVIDEKGLLPRDLRSYMIQKYGPVRDKDGNGRLGDYHPDLKVVFDDVQRQVKEYFF